MRTIKNILSFSLLFSVLVLTGCGGGGGSYWATNVNWYNGWGSGGSGIVIVRYLL